MSRSPSRSTLVVASVCFLMLAAAPASMAQRPFPPGHPPTKIEPVSLGEVGASMSSSSRASVEQQGSADSHDLPRRDQDKLGSFVRARSGQLQFCYHEALARHPGLAGAVTVAVTIQGDGEVSRVAVTQRSWAGSGTDEVESCLRRKIRSWRFPAANERRGTYPFSFSFTRGTQ